MKQRARVKQELATNLFMIGQLFDVGTSTYLLHRLGLKHEANFLARFIMQRWGLGPALAIKLVVMLVYGRKASPFHAGLSVGVMVNNVLSGIDTKR